MVRSAVASMPPSAGPRLRRPSAVLSPLSARDPSEADPLEALRLARPCRSPSLPSARLHPSEPRPPPPRPSRRPRSPPRMPRPWRRAWLRARARTRRLERPSRRALARGGSGGPVPEALLSMLQSSTAGAEGVGVLSTSASAATGYVLRPRRARLGPSAGAAGDQPPGRPVHGWPPEVLPDDGPRGEPQRLEPRVRGERRPAEGRAPRGCAGLGDCRRHRGERRRRRQHRRAGAPQDGGCGPERRGRAGSQQHRITGDGVPR